MEIINGKDIKRSSQANVIIYSKPGSGKTTVASLLPGKTLMLSIDGTEQVLEGSSTVDIARIDGKDPYKSLMEFYKYAKLKESEYDNFFIDNLTRYQKLWLNERSTKTKSGLPEMKDYAILDNHLLDVMEAFNSLKGNTIYTFWEATRQITHDDGQQYTQFVPDVRDKIANHLMGIVHIVARLYKTNEGKRGFFLEGNESIFAKNHLDNRKGCLQEELLKIGNKTEEEE